VPDTISNPDAMRVATARGDMRRQRAAASSIARGSPSMRAQIFAAAASASSSNTSAGFAAEARRMNRRTAGL
jgi:hypothetical protein